MLLTCAVGLRALHRVWDWAQVDYGVGLRAQCLGSGATLVAQAHETVNPKPQSTPHFCSDYLSSVYCGNSWNLNP